VYIPAIVVAVGCDVYSQSLLVDCESSTFDAGSKESGEHLDSGLSDAPLSSDSTVSFNTAIHSDTSPDAVGSDFESGNSNGLDAVTSEDSEIEEDARSDLNCLENPDSDFCSNSCEEIETCNGIDDDCDGLTDEAPAATSCNVPKAEVECDQGECAIVDCLDGFSNCDEDIDNGCETELGTDFDCSACNDSCDVPHAKAFSCVDRSCRIDSCEAGYAHCDESINNGCETQVNTLEHCGDCDQPCELDHADESCEDFQCVINHCDTGWLNCDALDADGCEHDDNDGPCVYLKVLFMPSEGDTKWLRLKFIIVNQRDIDIPIAELSLRYWYTIDTGSEEQFVECWHPDDPADCTAGLCCDEHVATRVVPTSGTGADYYLELSFAAGADVAAGGQTDHLSIGVHKNSWNDYDYSNDYSYENVADFTENERITLYHNGSLVWGVEP